MFSGLNLNKYQYKALPIYLKDVGYSLIIDKILVNNFLILLLDLYKSIESMEIIK